MTDTNTIIDANKVPTLNALFRLQWEESQQSHVLLYPEGMVKLNFSAGEILATCDGQRTVGEVVDHLKQRFNDVEGIEHDILDFLGEAHELHWLQLA